MQFKRYCGLLAVLATLTLPCAAAPPKPPPPIDTAPHIVVQKRPAGAFAPLAFSPDGRLLAIAGYGQEIALWNVVDGHLVSTVVPHNHQVNSICFSPDGTLFASAGYDKTISVWDVATGRETKTLAGHLKQVNSVTFSPDGRYLASGSDDETLRVWDVSSGQQTALFKGKNTGNVSDVHFTKDGGRVIGCNGHKSTVVWDIASGKSALTFADAYAPLALSPDGALLAARGKGETLDFWSLSTGVKVKTLAGRFPKIKDRMNQHKGALSIVTYYAKSYINPFAKLKKTDVFYENRDKNSMSWSPDGKTIATGSLENGGGHNTIQIWDTDTGNITQKIEPGMEWVNSVTFSPDGRYLASGSGELTINLWDITKGDKLLSLVSAGGTDWVAITPEGRFDGTPDGMKNLHWEQDDAAGKRSIPLNAFFNEFYTPHLISRVVSGQILPAPKVVIHHGIKPPPVVRITSPLPGLTNTQTVQVTVEATDQGGGVQNIQLFQNGSRVEDDLKRLEEVTADPSKTRTFSLALVAGSNILRATAANNDGTECAAPPEITLTYSGTPAPPDLYVLAVGIEQYKNPNFRLTYCKSDTQAFLSMVQARGQSIFHTIHKMVLLDAQVTRPNLEGAFARIKALAKPNDAFIFYYSGHGAMPPSDGSDWYLICQDVVQLEGPQGIKAKGMSAHELKTLSTQVPALKKLLVLDACQSGGALDAFQNKGLAEETAIAQLSHSTGTVILAASLKAQSAQVIESLKHSVFTYALLQGLSGDADRPVNGSVTVKKLDSYLTNQLPLLTQKYGGQAQYPTSCSFGQDFPLGVH